MHTIFGSSCYSCRVERYPLQGFRWVGSNRRYKLRHWPPGTNIKPFVPYFFVPARAWPRRRAAPAPQMPQALTQGRTPAPGTSAWYPQKLSLLPSRPQEVWRLLSEEDDSEIVGAFSLPGEPHRFPINFFVIRFPFIVHPIYNQR